MSDETRKDTLRIGLARSAAHWAKYHPKKPAIVTDGRDVTYGDLEALACRYHALAEERGATFGQRVGLQLFDRAHFLAALTGVIRTGATAVIIQPDWPDGYISAAIEDADCMLVFRDKAPLAKESPFEAFGIEQIISSDNLNIKVMPKTRHHSDEWGILYSSGTTGRPKGIVRTDWAMLSESLSWIFEMPITRDTVFYNGRPFYYTGGLVLGVATLLVGGTLISPRSHSPEALDQAASAMSLDYAFLSPYQIEEIVVQARSGRKFGVPSTILTMGTYIEAHLKQEAIELLGCDLMESWGNTEGLGTLSERSDTRFRPNSIGRAFVGDVMTVVDKNGVELGPNQAGQLAGASDTNLLRYERREDDDRCVRSGDLIISEDVGYYDADGYFYLLGRTADFFTKNGEEINLRDIERALMRFDGVSAACAIMVESASDDPLLIMTVVELRSASRGVPAAVIKEAVNANLTASARINEMIIVERLERNAGGKIIVAKVRDLIRDIFHQREDTKVATIAGKI